MNKSILMMRRKERLRKLRNLRKSRTDMGRSTRWRKVRLKTRWHLSESIITRIETLAWSIIRRGSMTIIRVPRFPCTLPALTPHSNSPTSIPNLINSIPKVWTTCNLNTVPNSSTIIISNLSWCISKWPHKSQQILCRNCHSTIRILDFHRVKFP
jgi:hypothetical protein